MEAIETTRNIKTGVLCSSVVSEVLFLVALGAQDSGGPGMGLIVMASIFVGPILFAILQLILILPWYFLLRDLKHLSFITLYCATTISTFVLFLFIGHDQAATLQNILGMAVVISILLLILISTFWVCSHPGISDEDQS
jgi:hypothetical protein